MSNLKEKLVLKLSEILPHSIVEDIKKLNKEEKTEVKMAEYKTVEGAVLMVDGELTEGSAAKVIGADGVENAAEGTYVLETGETVTCVGGFITQVVPMAESNPPAVDPQSQPEIPSAMKAEMEKQGAELADLRTKYDQVVKHNTDLAAALKKILETPIEVKQSKQVSQADLDSMTALERRRYIRENH